MPPSAIRGPKSKQATGRNRSSRNEDEQHTSGGRDGSNGASDADSMIDEDSRSGSAAAMQTNKKSRAASSAAAASSASYSSSAAASASASSAPTPCGRLDADSLSVVYSFLSMQDFLRAVRVSRHWRAARTKRSAWPAFSLQTMIQSLRDDDFDSPQRRKLELSLKSGNKTKLSALLSQPAVRDLWRHVTEVKLVHERVGSNKEGAASAAMMTQLPQFASLAALTLDGFIVDGAASQPITDLLSVLSSRLLMLGLFRCGRQFERQLHQLSSLRVLVLGWIPFADNLLSLHQLVYLRIERDRGLDVNSNARLGFVIRWLSVHHSLRSLSVEGQTGSPWLLPETDNFVTALLSCEAPSVVNAADCANLNRTLQPPLDPTVPCALADLSINELAPTAKSMLADLPALTRLQSRVEHADEEAEPCGLLDAELAPSLQLALPRLQELRMEGPATEPHWHHLAHCTALRVVHLTEARRYGNQPGPSPLSRSTLQSLLRAWSGTIEECRLEIEMQLSDTDPSSGRDEWIELAACHRLRVLHLQLTKGQPLSAGLVTALQGLPAFHTLSLIWSGSVIRPLPPNLLAVMARSRSFSSLHLHAASSAFRVPDFVQSKQQSSTRPPGLSSMLSSVDPSLLTRRTLRRLRVVGFHHEPTLAHDATEYAFRIAKTADNQFGWERDPN